MENQSERQCSKCCRILGVEEFESENKNCNRCLEHRRTCYEKHKEEYRAEANRRWKEDEEYREKKMERHKQWNNKLYFCSECDLSMYLRNKARHEKTSKHQRNVVVKLNNEM